MPYSHFAFRSCRNISSKSLVAYFRSVIFVIFRRAQNVVKIALTVFLLKRLSGVCLKPFHSQRKPLKIGFRFSHGCAVQAACLFPLTFPLWCSQEISLHKSDEVESISKFFMGNRFHVTLHNRSSEIGKQCTWVKCWTVEA